MSALSVLRTVLGPSVGWFLMMVSSVLTGFITLAQIMIWKYLKCLASTLILSSLLMLSTKLILWSLMVILILSLRLGKNLFLLLPRSLKESFIELSLNMNLITMTKNKIKNNNKKAKAIQADVHRQIAAMNKKLNKLAVDEQLSTTLRKQAKAHAKRTKRRGLNLPAGISQTLTSGPSADWLSLVSSPMTATCAGVVPPFGHFNEGWWVTRKVTSEFNMSVAAGQRVAIAVALNTSAPLQVVTSSSIPVALPYILASNTAGEPTSVGYQASLLPDIQGTIQNFYQSLWNQVSYATVLEGAAGQQMYTAVYSGAMPLGIPIVAHVKLTNTTSLTTVGGSMYADIVTPQVYNVSTASDGTYDFRYVLGDQTIQLSKQSKPATTNAVVCATATCDETVFSNAHPMGVINCTSGSARGAAWAMAYNSTSAAQSYKVEIAYVYMLEPLQNSGLFDLAVRPALVAAAATGHTMATVTRLAAEAASSDGNVAEAFKTGSNALQAGKDIMSGNYLGAATDLYRTGAGIRKLWKSKAK